MAPKTARSSGDKTDWAKITRRGKDKRDLTGVNKRPTSIMARPTGKNTTGHVKDAKSDDNFTPPQEVRGKDKSQSSITSFLAGGAQESCTTRAILPLGNSQSTTETVPLGTYSENILPETKEPLIKSAQGGDSLLRALESSVVTRRKERGSPFREEGLQVQRSETLIGGDTVSNATATSGTEAVQYMPPNLKGGDNEPEKGMKPLDWAKDSGDKFLSLTEE
ncbi:hypothetical protein NDU88_001051 [Pleurodeles waltl]|uniref:Uncharacterized protein n=1 Tax=Pleurodeles waltl TaxID=8319 RepID=A0AAV7VVB7_PLEWA|nr:hypothetical protein NDU88_001051 [Pleurodeles waltl]